MLLRRLASAVAPWRYPRGEKDGAEPGFVAELAVCAGLGDLRRRICHEISDRFSARHTVIVETTDGGMTYRATWPADDSRPALTLPGAGRLARWLRVNAVPLRVGRDPELHAYWSARNAIS